MNAWVLVRFFSGSLGLDGFLKGESNFILGGKSRREVVQQVL